MVLVKGLLDGRVPAFVVLGHAVSAVVWGLEMQRAVSAMEVVVVVRERHPWVWVDFRAKKFRCSQGL